MARVATARVSHKTRNPRKNKKWPKSRFRAKKSQSRSKSRSGSRFSSFPLQQQNLLPIYFLTYFETFPETYS